ncbi:MAG: M28 family peptidase [Flavobacteriales bacterium]
MKKVVLVLIISFISITTISLLALTNPTFSTKKKLDFTVQADSNRMKIYVDSLCRENEFRTWNNTRELHRAGNYIYDELAKYSERTTRQKFEDKRNEYFNVISSFGPENAPRLIIGAHYNVCGMQQGADDNASGVSAIIELARMLKANSTELDFRIDLVAYTLEEPPFFRDFMMGSAVHARSLKKDSVDVLGMISVEMIGFFSDVKGSQDYPVKAMKLVYPTKANYISVVSKFGEGDFLRKVKRSLNDQNRVNVRSVSAPASVPGIDFSDHHNYWDQGYTALMITDTSFYRNANYHRPSDLPETLNYAKMAAVTDGIFQFVVYFRP